MLEFCNVHTLAFAGGGNRCWWQAGLLTQLQANGARLPGLMVGTSAGAAIAASFLTNSTETALQAGKRLYAANAQLFDWRGLARFRFSFAHQTIYPAWLAAFVHDGNFSTLQSAPSQLLVAVTRPARALGLTGSIAAGTLAYLVDKKMFHHIHPALPRFLGLKQAFFSLQDCTTVQEVQATLQAAAAAPPFMSGVRLHGAWAIDGGYTDNAPLPVQTSDEKASTLVLLTRHYPDRAPLFQAHGRTYWQPSQKIPVSTWDCRPDTTVEDAFNLGQEDARQRVQRGDIDLSE
jgi:predicted acylesterase/phospholipase RssA